MVDIASLPSGPVGNIYLRPSGPKLSGEMTPGHKHPYPHVTFPYGQVNVKAQWPNGRLVDQDFETGQWFLSAAGCEHEITAIQPSYDEARAAYQHLSQEELLHQLAMIKSAPSSWTCVYAHRNHQGEVLQYNMGWRESYE